MANAILNTPERATASLPVLSPIDLNPQVQAQLPLARSDGDTIFAMPEKRSHPASTARRLFTSTPASAPRHTGRADSSTRLSSTRSSGSIRRHSTASARSRNPAKSLPSPRSSNAPTSFDDDDAGNSTDADNDDNGDDGNDAWRETLAFATDRTVPLGPTPQRDGRIVGLFASLDDPSTDLASLESRYLQSPTSLRAGSVAADRTAHDGSSPSKRRKVDARFIDRDAPVGSVSTSTGTSAITATVSVPSYRTLQDSSTIETPDCLRTRSFTFADMPMAADLAAVDNSGGGGGVTGTEISTSTTSTRRRLFATRCQPDAVAIPSPSLSSTSVGAATLIDPPTAAAAAAADGSTPGGRRDRDRPHPDRARRAGGRHHRPPLALSQIIRNLRQLEEAVTEDGDALEALRELEADDAASARSRSQGGGVHHVDHGPSRAEEEDENQSGAGANAGVGSKPWRKKGLKRQTRRVKLKPTTAAQQDAARQRDRERERQRDRDRECQQSRAVAERDEVKPDTPVGPEPRSEQEIPSDAEPNDDDADELGDGPSSTATKSAPHTTTGGSKQSLRQRPKPAVASSNFRSLKLRNSGHGGGRRLPARFRRNR